MAKTKISEFDSTPANNTDIDSINIAEGCAPSGINNAIRELMSQLKDQQTGASGDNFTVGGNLAVTGSTTFTGAVVMSTALPVASGGTGANTVGGARTSLSAAGSGANSDITSLTGLTTALSVTQGGTGQTSYTNGQLLIGNTTGNTLSKATLTAGSGVTITNGGGSITIAAVGDGSGTVTSVTAGNGLTGGTITTSGTIAIGAPSSNSIGSYAMVAGYGSDTPTTAYTFGSDYSAGSSQGQLGIMHIKDVSNALTIGRSYGNITGTWRWLGASITGLGSGEYVYAIAVRVA